MSNTKNALLSAATACSLITGITMVIGSSVTFLQGNLTAPGSTLVEHRIPPNGLLHASAPQALLTQAASQMILGMLLITLGFLFYVLSLIQEQRKVKITHVPPHSPQQLAMRRAARKGPKWFWVEISV